MKFSVLSIGVKSAIKNTRNIAILGLSVFASGTLLADEANERAVEVIQIFGDNNALEQATGSADLIDTQALEQFEYDDIHRVLQAIPGVYIREEDGYGLRPNIGLRGATNERSSKVAIMEDGILIAPAPYSAPAAYYFPLISRMQKVEVFKGPAAIKYGPNTVGGAINLVSTSIEESGQGQVDLALGQQGYRKAYGRYSQDVAGLNVLLEGTHIAADGFKELDNGGDTGFSKNEILSKIAYVPSKSDLYQRWLFKIAYSDEVSDETYLGLSDQDFEINPNRRYVASEQDKLDWEHLQMSLSHYIELSQDTILHTQAYRRDFNRDWDRLNRFNSSRPIASILASPNTGLNALFMQVLRGERDSLTDDETLAQTLNDRTFFSQGLQTRLLSEHSFNSVDLSIDAGIRIHQDQVERLHRDRFFDIRDSRLVRSLQTDIVTTENRDKVTAIAAYIDTQWQWDKLRASFGLRLEDINADAFDNISLVSQETKDTVVLPGLGLFYQFNPHLGALFGVNKGFVPNSPGQASDIAPEESWNYELGLRANYAGWQSELIGFFNDYRNLKGTCTFSSGCQQTLDIDFNGGEVDVYGLEFQLDKSFVINKSISMPFGLAYTHTQTAFKTAFDSDFSQWGRVSVSDELPYIPKDQLALQLGLVGEVWRAELSYKFVAKMLEAAGTNTELAGVFTDQVNQLDFSAWYELNEATRLYFKIDNLSGEQVIVSRRPFGARPNKPRQMILGVKYTFN